MKSLDLHGYGTYDAMDAVVAFVKKAHEDGEDYIEIIHGAPDVRHHMHVQIVGRGSIKWGLRGLLNRGELNKWVYPRRSKKHKIYDGSMILRVKI